MSTAPRITVSPRRALITVSRSVHLDGFTPGQPVTVSATSVWHDGTTWASKARYLADAQGHADLAGMPLDGYAMPSPMGIVWSMRCDSASPAYPPSSTRPITIELVARAGDVQASAELVQDFMAEGVTMREVQEGGVCGELYLPPGPGPHPVVVFMNGSSGGINGPRAALFAAEGYACLALGVFNCKGRPRYITRTPLEYFENALRWVHATLAPKDGFVAVSGISRGGEMSLLIPSYFPDLVSAVVAYVPTSVINSTASAGHPDESRSATTWTYRGQDLPNVWEPSATADWGRAVPYKDEGVRQTPAFVSTLEDPDAVARASIPVHNIRCPVLLISAMDDGFWPSTLYCELVARKLQSPWRRLDCVGAGHYIYYPGLPTTLVSKKHAMSGMLVSAGGAPEANALANDVAHAAVQAFLRDVRSGAL